MPTKKSSKNVTKKTTTKKSTAKPAASKKSPSKSSKQAAKKPAAKKTTKKATTPKPAKAPTKKAEEVEVVTPEQRKYSTKVYVLLGLIVVLIIVALVLMFKLGDKKLFSFDDDTKTIVNTPPVTVIEEEEEKSTTGKRAIDGVEVALDDMFNVPGCVMIENLAGEGVRPQSGLSSASIVYEVVVEGGITRFMAVFPGVTENAAGDADLEIGPIRSARDTYLEFVSELDCAYTHAGGSFTALRAIPRFELKDIDALREAGYFYRKSGKVGPHNLFSNLADVHNAIVDGHSWTEDVEIDTWNFVDTEAASELEGDEATEVNILYGGAYNAEYRYNAETNSYDRYHAGVAHTDANTGNIISAQNVIIQRVPPGVFIEGKGRINFDVNGEGEVHVFRNGQVVAGIWKKPSRTERTQFFYKDTGEQIELIPGASWVSIVPEGTEFNFGTGE